MAFVKVKVDALEQQKKEYEKANKKPRMVLWSRSKK